VPTRVGLGLIDWPFASAVGWWRWVDLCEEGGVDSLWLADRLSGEAPTLECLSAMAAVAGRTRRLKFGMSVLSVGLREPLVVAKACATIDYLSNGRLLPAFGLGALISPDWAAAGRAPEGQGAAFDEALELIARLWRGETVDFDGVHVKARGARIAPLPVQAELPLWIGGSSPAAIRRTAKYGTGWLGGVEGPEAAGRGCGDQGRRRRTGPRHRSRSLRRGRLLPVHRAGRGGGPRSVTAAATGPRRGGRRRRPGDPAAHP
jgi:alkanesulfonate monooxygenase SsuD/methylene tetrahydromethanopterin reductase-like flavin-dependent oxidoreductase (luciferase family)